MKRDVSLPTEFAELSGKVAFVQQKSSQEFCSTCPRCGGTLHSSGEYPDRFVMLLSSTATGGPFGFCRVCNFRWLPGRDAGASVSPETLALLEEQAQGYRDRIAAERKTKLAKFTTGELWAELHARMQEEQRQWWRTQGIPDEWQNYLRLGYMPEKIYTGGDGELHKSPAYTIPYFHERWQFCTMQYRLIDPDQPQSRYRFESKLGTTYYMVTPSQPIMDKVIVCEGAKKGIVAHINSGELAKNTTFLAIPSKDDWRSSGILDAIKDCGMVWILLDPDCWNRPERAKDDWKPAPVLFAEAIGKNARIVDMPMKVDDAILQMGMSDDEFGACLKYARRL